MTEARDVTQYFHPVLESRALRGKPVRVQLAGRYYVLFRDRLGTAGALVDVCPHRFTPLSAGRVRPDGRIECGYHGWHFDRDGKGCNPSQPGQKHCDAAPLQAVERKGYVWVAAPEVSLERFPDLTWDDREPTGTYRAHLSVPLHTAVTNTIDISHTAHLHRAVTGYFANAISAVEPDFKSSEDQVEAVAEATVTHPILGTRSVHLHMWLRTDPLCVRSTISLRHARSGAPSLVDTYVVNFPVPENDHSTYLHEYWFFKPNSVGIRVLLPVIRPFMMATAMKLTRQDAEFLPCVADVPMEMKGMHLDRFDRFVSEGLNLIRRSAYGPIAAPVERLSPPRV
jgi:phenylpropionate dioxygenase-like ring-hydroxylating dioxygenase large terminal subunit